MNETATATSTTTATATVTLSKTVQSLLTRIASSPELLRGTSELKKKLHTQGDSKSQGTGNQVTDQEACFAALLEESSILYYNHTQTDNGFYYIYQVNGTQRAIDFQIFELIDGVKKSIYNFDLKHTKSDTFFLNDGWFHTNVIYIISWVRNLSQPRKKKVTQPSTFIALGQNIPTHDEIALHADLCEIKKKYNTQYKGVDSFHCYIRFANTYKCQRFTPDYSHTSLLSVLAFLTPRKRPQIAL